MTRRPMNKSLNNRSECMIGRIHRLNSSMVILSLFVCLFLSSCDRAKRSTTDTDAAKPVLSASPNPVPAGDIEKPLGSTMITWDTGNSAPGDLYVKVNREPEQFITRAPKGTHEVRWIQFDSLYEFRLYAKKRSKLLAKLEVTRDD
jgi:hypothetical protein